MKTLAVVNQKGGVGKTSNVVHIAFGLVARGLKVAFLDLDTQANASHTLKKYAGGDDSYACFSGLQNFELVNDLTLFAASPRLLLVDGMGVEKAARNLKSSLNLLHANGVDVCLIDTAPSIGVRMIAALNVSDFALSPIKLEPFSLWGVKQMQATIRKSREVNPGLRFLGILPTMYDRRNPRHKEMYATLRELYPQLLIPHSIGMRSSVDEAVARGIPVWDIKRSAAKKAASEFRELNRYIEEKMEMAR